jgi:hypothetical protein
MQRLFVQRRRRLREYIVVGLRPAHAEHPPEGPLQLVLELQLLLRRGAGATPVQYQDRVLDEARGSDQVDALRHPILATFQRVAGTAALQHIGDRAVAVVEHRDLHGRVVAALHILREHRSVAAQVGVGSAHMLLQRAAVGHRHGCGGDVPHRRSRSHQRVCRCVVH